MARKKEPLVPVSGMLPSSFVKAMDKYVQIGVYAKTRSQFIAKAVKATVNRLDLAAYPEKL